MTATVRVMRRQAQVMITHGCSTNNKEKLELKSTGKPIPLADIVESFQRTGGCLRQEEGQVPHRQEDHCYIYACQHDNRQPPWEDTAHCPGIVTRMDARDSGSTRCGADEE